VRGFARTLALTVLIGLPLAACSNGAITDPRPGDATITAALLQEVNDARSSSRRCGTQSFAAAAPLRLESRLTAAAEAHSQDMYDHGFMSHTGSDGSDVVRRVERQGYTWSRVGRERRRRLLVACGRGGGVAREPRPLRQHHELGIHGTRTR
jgi:hypothetical protein